MVSIKISTANEAFNVPGPEIARILRHLADVAEPMETPGDWSTKVFDNNGNTVGSFKYTEE